jgi:hypothetical protein
MKQTIEICKCDLCGSEENVTKDIQTMAYRTFDATDGRTFYKEPIYERVKLDICKNCLKQVVLIHSVGVQRQEYRRDHV